MDSSALSKWKNPISLTLAPKLHRDICSLPMLIQKEKCTQQQVIYIVNTLFHTLYPQNYL